MSSVHFICGPAGAGKTTYAIGLARELPAVRFTIDEWMVTLFSPDKPAVADWPWIAERVGRCEAQMLSAVRALGAIGVSSVLDLSFLRAEDRRRVAAEADAAGLEVRLHVLAADATERWRRVEARNAQQGETFRLQVSRPMFDFVESIWEAPTPAEMQALNGRFVER